MDNNKLQDKIDKLKDQKAKVDPNEELKKQIKDLQQKVEDLTNKRITQSNLLPDVVKQRHIGEGVRYLRSGLEANLPTSGEEPMQGSAVYFCTDSKKLKIWDGSVWKSTTLS